MRRRAFITLLGGAAGWPLVARAQQGAMPVIGFLQTIAPGATAHMTAAFHRGLKEVGYVKGQNIEVVYRCADGQYDRLPTLVADLVRRRVALIGAAVFVHARCCTCSRRLLARTRSAASLSLRPHLNELRK